MKKQNAIDMLGGTPGKAAKAMGYKAVQTVYLWPETLPQSTADRVIGAAQRLKQSSVKRRGRVKGSLVKFACTVCKTVDLVPGGTSEYKCVKCRTRNGVDPLMTPQYLAHKAVAKAIKAGDLERPGKFKCVDCGTQATEYDHRDYSQPLTVDPVCRRCNLRRGSAISPNSSCADPSRIATDQATEVA